mmetsp:Transcript_18512/g.25743  ORF Transcript_18512/g.25743 Transcript_18512/m.25743 type:complete len:89 (+) Transcript_18512:677-943(+)
MRNFLDSIYKPNLIQGRYFRRKTSMNTEYASVDDRCQCQVIEYLTAIFPYIRAAVLSNALVKESIHLGHLTAFMVSTKEGDMSWVSCF